MSSINRELKEYIEREILPLYLSFDKAHNTDHAEAVISRSLELATAYDVDIDMVYAIAAFHDTGLKFGRELHHIHSGEILAADAFILGHFTAEQIETMCQAVEDHRASSKEAPRSIYGRIVAEADRCIDSMTVIRRTIQYGLANYPTLSAEQHYERCYAHLQEKYGEGGYLKLWIPHSANGLELAKLRAIIAKPEQLREAFDTIFSQEKES
jgi:uncharacterized protein